MARPKEKDEPSFDVWRCIGNFWQVRRYYIAPYVIAYMFGNKIEKITGTIILRVTRIPIGGRLEANYKNRF